MKKWLMFGLSMCILMAFVACGSSSSSKTFTIQDFEKAYQSQDSEFEFQEEKPLFQLIGATDGWIGNFKSNKVVKIYFYKDEKTYKKAVEDYGDLLKNMPKNGNYVFDGNNEEAKEIFLSVK